MHICGRGGEYSASISVKKIVETAAQDKADSVLLAHNHPNGIPMPSKEDVKVTKNIAEALYLVDIKLADHIIISGNEYSSMNECNYF